MLAYSDFFATGRNSKILSVVLGLSVDIGVFDVVVITADLFVTVLVGITLLPVGVELENLDFNLYAKPGDDRKLAKFNLLWLMPLVTALVASGRNVVVPDVLAAVVEVLESLPLDSSSAC